MVVISAEAVKELRRQTGVSVMECKKALEDAGGDKEKALKLLGVRAGATARSKASRTLGAGTVASYIHITGQVGAMVVLSCETDFVSKNEEFKELARLIAMHAAAMRPENTQMLGAQSFIKDEGKTIAELIADATQKFGERIEITDLAVFSLQ